MIKQLLEALQAGEIDMAEIKDLKLGNLSNSALPDGFWVSVIRIEEETSLKNTPNMRFDKGADQYIKKNPKIYLNYYLLFSYVSDLYDDGILVIHKLIKYFQKNSIITVTDGGEDLGRVSFELFTPSFEQLNQIWSIHGGKYLPSIIYKARISEYEHIAGEQIVQPVRSISTTYEQKS